MLSQTVFVVDAVRSPIARYRGALANVRPDDLAAAVISSLLARQPTAAEHISEVVLGATNQAGEDNRNVARMALLLTTLSVTVPAVTVNRLCGSGLDAINRGAMSIATGDAELIIAGGVESMTRAPFSMGKATEAFERTPPTVYDTTLGWRYPNPKMAERFQLESMGDTAENIADKWQISREEQDAYAFLSQEKAVRAIANGKFVKEIVPIILPTKKGAAQHLFIQDESPREDVALEKLARLAPAFRAKGSVTAGNSSPLNDGAAAVLLASEGAVKQYNLKPLARIVSFAVTGVEPALMGEGPISATIKAIGRAGCTIADLGLIELNEAFAAQAIACIRGLDLDPAKVNVNGGAIALGHPIGASGARIVATLLHAMADRKVKWGLASLCIGVGQGIATVFEAC